MKTTQLALYMTVDPQQTIAMMLGVSADEFTSLRNRVYEICDSNKGEYYTPETEIDISELSEEEVGRLAPHAVFAEYLADILHQMMGVAYPEGSDMTEGVGKMLKDIGRLAEESLPHAETNQVMSLLDGKLGEG